MLKSLTYTTLSEKQPNSYNLKKLPEMPAPTIMTLQELREAMNLSLVRMIQSRFGLWIQWRAESEFIGKKRKTVKSMQRQKWHVNGIFFKRQCGMNCANAE